MEEEALPQMALAVATGQRTKAVEEVVVHRMKAMAEEEAEGVLPKKLEHWVLVLESWGVEVVAVGQQMEVVQLDLWVEAEGVRQRLAVQHVRDRPLEKYVERTVGEFDWAVEEEPRTLFFLLGKVVVRRTSVLHRLRLLWASLEV